MSQHDLNIANQTSAAARADINAAYAALATQSSGTSAPSTTYANQWWYDTSAAILKIRNNADSAWLDVGIFSGGNFVPSPGLASQSEAVAGTNNTKFMTPLRVIEAVIPAKSIVTNGYIKLGGGIYLQWGRLTVATGGAGSVSFPVAFPSAVFSIVVTGVSNSVVQTGVSLNAGYSRTAFSYDVAVDDGTLAYSEIHWQAYGN